MSTCPHCYQQGLIQALRGDQTTVLLDPNARCYVAVDEHQVFPQDHSRVFLTTALVEHVALCPQRRRQQAEARAQRTAQVAARQAAKKGASR